MSEMRDINNSTINLYDKSKFIGDDILINKNIKNINVNKIPKRMTVTEREAQRQETLRPSLKERVGEIITCFGYVVKKYGKYNDRYTIINIVDKKGKFCADHIQLDFKTDDYEYNTNIIGKYVKFTGKVKLYERYDGSKDYTVDILEEVDIMSSRFYFNENDILDYKDVCIDHRYIDEYLSRVNITKIYDIINILRNEINDITDIDFLYYYILNQYTLNTATYRIYNGELRDQNFNEDMVLELLLLLGSTLFELKSKEINYLGDIMNLICQHCNLLQGINTYEGKGKYNDYDETKNPGLIDFYKKRLFYGKKFNKVGKEKIKDAWYFINFRKNNFYQEKPYKEYINEESIKMRAYFIIDQYIPKH